MGKTLHPCMLVAGTCTAPHNEECENDKGCVQQVWGYLVFSKADVDLSLQSTSSFQHVACKTEVEMKVSEPK